jgi:Trk K+ transport system NAD-binding subunit
VKFLSGHLGYALLDVQLRRNIKGLLKYLIFLGAVILVYSVLFHVLMLRFEGQDHSWLTGVYWTLTVMTTLGFGDITFHSDVGRVYSILVLLSGTILLLIVLPFTFIRYFYAPWLEAQLRLRAPREVPPETEGHMVITAWDGVAEGLANRLGTEGIQVFTVEEDGTKAARMHADGIPVVRGEVDDMPTHQRLRAPQARLIILNQNDLNNTNVALTIRDVAPTVPLAAVVEDENALDILELAGCNHVIPLKRRLGEQLANRVTAGHAQAHVVGNYRGLLIAEFSAHNTPLAGKTIGDARLREIAGVSVVGVWDQGKMAPSRPDLRLGSHSLPVVAGSREAMDRLNEFLCIYDTNWNPVVVIGGGKVGTAAARFLKHREIPVHVVERDPAMASDLEKIADRLVIGDAADREVMRRVGVEEAPSVLLTTNDDATNIYIAAYCRRLNPEAQIVSRITHDRNLPSIQRAGTDLTLSYSTLGVESVHALIHDRPPMALGEDMGFHKLSCPASLAGITLRESAVGVKTGLTVIGVETEERLVTDTGPGTLLEAGSTLLVIGTPEHLKAFREAFE